MTYSAFDEDVLGGSTSCSDTVDTSLVELSNDSVGRFIVEFIVAIKDDIVVGCELGRDIGPESLEVRCRSEHGAIVSSKVVRVNNGMSPSSGDELNGSLESGKISGIERRSHGSGCKTLHQEWNTEDVHAFVHESLDGRSIWPCVICTQHSRNISRAEFCTRFVDT